MKISKILRKMLSYSVSALGVLILSGFLSLQPISGTGPAGLGNKALAHHTDTQVCVDITGVTEDVKSPPGQAGRQGGVADSGKMDFNQDPPAHDYQSCIAGDKVKGWAWNTNLGYVSFMCSGGQNFSNGQNFSSDLLDNCGTIDYETIVMSPESADSDRRKVRGFAWGDNIGWISLGCDNGMNGDKLCGDLNNDGVIAAGTDEIGVNYGAYVALKDIPPLLAENCNAGTGPEGTIVRGDLFGYAWTDSVGWINLCGAHADIDEVFSLETTFTTSTSTTEIPGDGDGGTDPGTTPPGDLGGTAEITSNPVHANGEEYHEIQVQVKENGVPINMERFGKVDVQIKENGVSTREETIMDGEGSINILIAAEYINTVKADQVACQQISCTGSIPAANVGTFFYDNALKLFYNRTTSIAPTNSNNVVALSSFSVYIKNDAGETIQRMDMDGLTDASGNPKPKLLPFLPPVTVSEFTSPDESGAQKNDSIMAFINKSQEVHLTISKNADLAADLNVPGTLTTQLYDCSPKEYDYVFDPAGDGIVETPTVTPATGTEPETQTTTRDDTGIFNADYPGAESFARTIRTNTCLGQYDRSNNVPVTDIEELALDFSADDTITYDSNIFTTVDPDGTAAEFGSTNALGLEFIFSYELNGTTVRYFRNPGISGSNVQQTADIRGNIRLDGVVTEGFSADAIASSIGDNAQSKREEYAKAVKKLVKGSAREYAETATGQAVIGSARLRPTGVTLPGNTEEAGLFYLNPSNLGMSAGSTAPCEVVLRNDADNAIFDPNNDIKFPEEVTIVSEGCNVFIDQNIYWGAGDTAGRLGIIAFADLSTSPPRGGNIYICNLVTDISANLVADGSIYPYGTSINNCGPNSKSGYVNAVDGTPDFDTTNTARTATNELLKHQLAITGSIIGNNTFGGSMSMNPILCDGTKISRTNADGTENAAYNSQVDQAKKCDLNFFRYAKKIQNPLYLDGEAENQFCWAPTVDEESNIPGPRLSKKITPTGISDQNSCDQNSLSANYPTEGAGGHGVMNIEYRAPSANMPVFNQVSMQQ